MSDTEQVFNDEEWATLEKYHYDVSAWGGYPPTFCFAKGLMIVAYSDGGEARLYVYTVESVRKALEQARGLLAQADAEEEELDLEGALIEVGIEEYEE